MISEIKQKIGVGEFDYTALLSCLTRYKNPRMQIRRLLAHRDIVRIKKGLYVFGSLQERRFSKEVLANLIYGPSYISKEFALSYYGLIPERVFEVTSVTPNRNKRFLTAVGVFSYDHLALSAYTIGFTQIAIEPDKFCLMATPEKALVDTILSRGKIQSVDELERLLIEDLRISIPDITHLSVPKLRTIVQCVNRPAASLLLRCLERLHA